MFFRLSFFLSSNPLIFILIFSLCFQNDNNKDSLKKIVSDIIEEDPTIVWVLKASDVNNARGIIFVDSIERLNLAFERLSGEIVHANVFPDTIVSPSGSWMLQRYVQNPLLVNNRKFHIRAHVLAIGNCKVFLHKDILCYIAGTPFDENFDNLSAHITNFGMQQYFTGREADSKRMEGMQVEVKELDQVLSLEQCTIIRMQVRECMLSVFQTFLSDKADCKLFWPLPNCFEVFAADFLVDSLLQVYLLEVNVGPALSGHSCQSIGQRIVQSAIDIVLSNLNDQLFQMSAETVFERKEPIDEAAQDFEILYETAPKSSLVSCLEDTPTEQQPTAILFSEIFTNNILQLIERS